MDIDPAEVDESELYRILTTFVVPRPIGWISSVSSNGDYNLAPYSHYNGICAAPPVVMFAPAKRNGDLTDTARNVLETEEFAVNLVTESLLEQMDKTSAELEHEEGEFAFAGLDPAPSEKISAPRVAASPASFECILHDSLEIYSTTVIFGEVIHLHLDQSLLTDGKIDMKKVNAVGRLGGPHYTSIKFVDYTRKF